MAIYCLRLSIHLVNPSTLVYKNFDAINNSSLNFSARPKYKECMDSEKSKKWRKMNFKSSRASKVKEIGKENE